MPGAAVPPHTPGMTNTLNQRLLTVAAAALSGVAVWTLAVPVAGVDLTVDNGSGVQEVGAAQTAIAGLVAGLAAWAFMALLERFTRRPKPIWTVVAAVMLALSLTGPLSATTASAGATLAALHVAVGAVLIFGLRRTL